MIDDGARRPQGAPMSQEKVMLITGGSSGIGAATARRAHAAGYALVLAARGERGLHAAADQFGTPDRVMTQTCDVCEWPQVQALTAAALARFGRIDAVFANAGFGLTRGFTTATPEQWRAMVLTNVYGVALTIRANIASVTESRGHFILTGSVAGRKALPGSMYSATKWAVSAMGESLRQELNGTGARVTLIEPGFVETPFFENGSPQEDSLEADDVARAIMFALEQPSRVDVNEILVRPTTQEV
jgi:NADP-dependent 3-hydroxy acid dehydrogenase YdfG